MRHADDGTLNALLDGALPPEEAGALRAHMLLCADCRRRLEDARALHDQADSLLASGLPAFAPPPPFEELARRAAAGATASPAGPAPEPWRAWRPRVHTLAWAATVILALAGGWWGRALIQPGRNNLTESGRLAGVVAPQAVPFSAGPAAATVGSAPGAPSAAEAASTRFAPAAPAAPAGAGASPAAHAPAVAQAAAPPAVAGHRLEGGPIVAASPAVQGELVRARAGAAAAAPGAGREPPLRVAEALDAAGAAPLADSVARRLAAAAPAPAPVPRVPPPVAVQESDFAAAGKAMQEKALASAAGRTLVTAQNVEAAPTFTPYTVAPMLQNREDVRRALVRNYPQEMKDAGVGGTTLVWLLIDETGAVRRTQVKTSSGSLALDRAALEVAAGMRFSPAMNRDQATTVWVALPIIFRSTR